MPLKQQSKRMLISRGTLDNFKNNWQEVINLYPWNHSHKIDQAKLTKITGINWQSLS